MRFLAQFFVTLLVAAAVGYFFPWWSMVVAAAVVGLCVYYRRSFTSFMAGFLAVALLWGGYAFYLSGADTGLQDRFGGLLGVSGEVLPLVVALFGGLLAGLAAWSGTLGRKLVQSEAG